MTLLFSVLAMTAVFACWFVPLALLVGALDRRYPWYQTWPIFVLVLLTAPGLLFALGRLLVSP